MLHQSFITPPSWLAFELNILRRLQFDSIALPFAGEPRLAAYLKRLDLRVSANDFLPSAYAKLIADVQNNGEKLPEETVGTILEDVYVPRQNLQNQTLRRWFGETDAWWFDNVRRNIEAVERATMKAVALKIGLEVGDYAQSFTDATLELRQPLSKVFLRLWNNQTEVFDNRKTNACTNKTAAEFTAETTADLWYLRLPRAHNQSLKNALGREAWREEWIRGGDYFWEDMNKTASGKFGSPTQTKSQYLQLLEDLFRTASHIEKWAISHIEDGFIQTADIIETIGRIRRVETIYTKDFSELTGTKAVIITA